MPPRIRRRITDAKREEIEQEEKALLQNIVRPFELVANLPVSFSAPPNGHYEDVLKNPLTVKDSGVFYRSLIKSRESYIQLCPMFELYWMKLTAHAKKLQSQGQDITGANNKKPLVKTARVPVLGTDVSARDVMVKLCDATLNIGPHVFEIRLFIAKDERSDKEKGRERELAKAKEKEEKAKEKSERERLSREAKEARAREKEKEMDLKRLRAEEKQRLKLQTPPVYGGTYSPIGTYPPGSYAPGSLPRPGMPSVGFAPVSTPLGGSTPLGAGPGPSAASLNGATASVSSAISQPAPATAFLGPPGLALAPITVPSVPSAPKTSAPSIYQPPRMSTLSSGIAGSLAAQGPLKPPPQPAVNSPIAASALTPSGAAPSAPTATASAPPSAISDTSASLAIGLGSTPGVAPGSSVNSKAGLPSSIPTTVHITATTSSGPSATPAPTLAGHTSSSAAKPVAGVNGVSSSQILVPVSSDSPVTATTLPSGVSNGVSIPNARPGPAVAVGASATVLSAPGTLPSVAAPPGPLVPGTSGAPGAAGLSNTPQGPSGPSTVPGPPGSSVPGPPGQPRPPPPRSDPNNMQSVENTIMIANLNAIARVDHSLNTLMKIVALGGASPAQIMRFQGYIQRAREMGPQPHHAHLLRQLPPGLRIPVAKPMAPAKPSPAKKVREPKVVVKKPPPSKELKLTAFQERYLENATILFEFVENPNFRYALPKNAISEVISEVKPPVDEEDEQPTDLLQSFLWIHNIGEFQEYEAKYAEYENAVKAKEEQERKKREEEEEKKRKEEEELEKKKEEEVKEEKKSNENEQTEEGKEGNIKTEPQAEPAVAEEPRLTRNRRNRRPAPPPPPPKKVKPKPEKKLIPPEEIDVKFTALSYSIKGIPNRFIPIFVKSSPSTETVAKKMSQILDKGSRMPNYYLWYQVDGKLDENLAEELRVELNQEEKKMPGVTYTSSTTVNELNDKKRKQREEKEERIRLKKLKKLEEKKEKEYTPQTDSELSTPVVKIEDDLEGNVKRETNHNEVINVDDETETEANTPNTNHQDKDDLEMAGAHNDEASEEDVTMEGQDEDGEKDAKETPENPTLGQVKKEEDNASDTLMDS